MRCHPLALLLASALIAACGLPPRHALDDRGGPREYIATDVLREGAPVALVPGTELTVAFAEGSVQFRAGCKHMGADVEVTADRLEVGEIESTDVDCDEALHEQEDWVSDFFSSNPTWEATSDGAVTMRAGTTDIVLQEKAR